MQALPILGLTPCLRKENLLILLTRKIARTLLPRRLPPVSESLNLQGSIDHLALPVTVMKVLFVIPRQFAHMLRDADRVQLPLKVVAVLEFHVCSRLLLIELPRRQRKAQVLGHLTDTLADGVGLPGPRTCVFLPLADLDEAVRRGRRFVGHLDLGPDAGVAVVAVAVHGHSALREDLLVARHPVLVVGLGLHGEVHFALLRVVAGAAGAADHEEVEGEAVVFAVGVGLAVLDLVLAAGHRGC